MKAQKILTIAIACIGIFWAIFNLSRARAIGDLQDIESDALRGTLRFSQQDLVQAIDGSSSQNLSACDTSSWRALLLAEMPLADSALRSGAVKEFDHRVKAIEAGALRVLSCAPRESFVWLLLFTDKVLHGQLDQQSFGFLENSYETSPNEAWIALRRAPVAIPFAMQASEPLRQKILNEFQSLIRNGFVDEAAHAYALAALPMRDLLQQEVQRLNPSQSKAFSDALQKLHS